MVLELISKTNIWLAILADAHTFLLYIKQESFVSLLMESRQRYQIMKEK